MKKDYLKKEWDFIVNEVHKKVKVRKKVIKREVLFVLQILLARREFDLYSKLKRVYLNSF